LSAYSPHIDSSSITGNTAPVGSGADVYNAGTLYLDNTSIMDRVDEMLREREAERSQTKQLDILERHAQFTERDGDLDPLGEFVGLPNMEMLRTIYAKNIDHVSQARLNARSQGRKLTQSA
jgi:hypothetical protein